MKLGKPARVLARAAAIVGLAAWTLGVGEIFVRELAPQALMPRYVTGSPWGVRRNIPGVVYRHQTPEVDVTYRINRWGLRSDVDFTLATPPKTCRIALFGDSYAIGYELPQQATFAHRLEQMLSTPERPVQVLNFGVSGFGTAESLRTYLAFAQRFGPDLVLMQWQVTDFDDNSRAGLYLLKGGKAVDGARSYMPGVAVQDRLMRNALYRQVADNSHLYNFLREQIGWQGKRLMALWSKRRAAPGDTRPDNESGNYQISPAQAQLSGAILVRARDEARARNAGFLVYDIPNRTPPKMFSTSYTLLPEALQAELPPVSMLLPFRREAAKGNRLFFTKGARHLTPLGAQTVARTLAQRITEDKLLDRCRARVADRG